VQEQVKGVRTLQRQNRLLASNLDVLQHKISSDVKQRSVVEKVNKRRQAEHACTLAELQANVSAKDVQVSSPVAMLRDRQQW
jgi:hypothetical protein